MSFTATVENDIIKLPPGVHLPDGTEVTIVPPKEEVPTLLEAFAEFAGCVRSGVGDIAENHDHYAHGGPKGSDRV